MAALTEDRNTPYREGVELEYDVAASTKIFGGSLVCLNATGYAVPGADTASFKFAGVAQEQVDNTGGADGDKKIRVRKTGIHRFAASGMTIADIGKPAFVSDDQTVAKSGLTNWVGCGRIDEFISATEVGVDIEAEPSAESDADSVAADVATIVADHNDLLAKLRVAGVLAS